MKLGFQILFVIAAVSAFAEDFCGIIDTPVTWTKENSPYRITGDIQISPGSRLTIEAGVEVLIVPGEACGETKQVDWSDSTYISIKAHGPIVIKGTAEEPVRILPEKHIPGKIQWDGIRLSMKDKASAIIEYLHIMGANKAINVSYSKFNVGNSLFMGNGTGVWLESEADLSIYNCVFTENLSAGIFLKNSRPAIAANIFYKNSNFGIWSDSRPSTRIKNNLFFANADTDCRYCPAGTSKIIQTEGETVPKDKFGNIFSNPVFIGSEEEKLMAEKDPSLPTPIKSVKDTAIKNIYEKAKGTNSLTEPNSATPFSLSKYSPALHTAPKTEFFKNVDGSLGDIGLYGGKPDRSGKSISM